MARGRLIGALQAVVLGLAAAGPLLGCGGARRTPSLAELPLPEGARIVAQVRSCDRGVAAYCSLALAVEDDGFASADALATAQERRLRAAHWTFVGAYTGDEHAAESPNHALRVTWATSYGDLKGTLLGWIHRPQAVKLALDHAFIAHRSAISVLLENGSG